MNYLKNRNVDLTNVKVVKQIRVLYLYCYTYTILAQEKKPTYIVHFFLTQEHILVVVVVLQLSPSEGEEDEWFRQRGSLSQLKHTESSNPASEEDSSKIFKKEDSSKFHPAGAADQDKATAKATPATPPATSHDKTTTSAATSGTPAMKRSSSGSRLQRKRPPRLAVSKSRLGKGSGEQGAGAFGDCLDFCKENLFRSGEGGDGEEEVVVPQEKILHRINSKMSLHSYQLGNQLSFRWTTGAGPRIGCVRDYPPELQFRSLEQVSLSPRGGAGPPKLGTTPRQSPCAPLVPSKPGGLVSPLYGHGGAGTRAPRLQHGAAQKIVLGDGRPDGQGRSFFSC
jgi:hypothetical protein